MGIMIDYLRTVFAANQQNLEKSYKTYHVPEVTYFNLYESSSFRIKLYYIWHPTRKYLVCPHSHKYNFYTEVLSGSVINHTYQDIPISSICPYVNANKFVTKDLNESEEFLNMAHLRPTKSESYKVGSGYYMEADQIHTLEIESNYVILLLREYRKTKVTSSLYRSFDNQLNVQITPTYEKFESRPLMVKKFLEIVDMVG